MSDLKAGQFYWAQVPADRPSKVYGDKTVVELISPILQDTRVIGWKLSVLGIPGHLTTQDLDLIKHIRVPAGIRNKIITFAP
jgi:hypothetical protein